MTTAIITITTPDTLKRRFQAAPTARGGRLALSQPMIPAFADDYPDGHLLVLCADFDRLHATLAATPFDDEAALDVAWEARQAVADKLATLRPITDAGRRAKAAVTVAILSEVAKWQRDSEVMFALASARAEAGL